MLGLRLASSVVLLVAASGCGPFLGLESGQLDDSGMQPTDDGGRDVGGTTTDTPTTTDDSGETTTDSGDAEITDTGEAEAEMTDSGDAEITDTGDAEVEITDSGDAEITDTGDAEITDTGDAEITDTGDAEITDTGETTDTGELTDVEIEAETTDTGELEDTGEMEDTGELEDTGDTEEPVGAAWRGIAYHPHADSECTDLDLLGGSWYYDWLPSQPCEKEGYVPMIWSDWFITDGMEEIYLEPLIGSSYDALLGFNEPDNAWQANMTVDRAIELWPLLESTGLRLGSPAPMQGGSWWLRSFLSKAKAKGYRVDFLALHWYGDCSNTSGLETFIESYQDLNMPIWITEFSCYEDSAEVNEAFMAMAIPVLESHPEVERFAWFANRTVEAAYTGTPLVDSAGTITPLGQIYADFESNWPAVP
jgi:hypothetical protein